MATSIELIELCPASYLLRIPAADIAWLFNPWAEITKFVDREALSFNGVVCPDTPLQRGQSCNLIEFPIFHMMYLQGMLFRGEKPRLIGTERQLQTAGDAFRRGLYGFYNSAEMRDCDLARREREALQGEIVGLAPDNTIKPLEQLLELVTLDATYNGARIEKRGTNVFEVAYGDEAVTVDCNLGRTQNYAPPYHIDCKYIAPSAFQVIDSGEEDGFAPNSCLHTVIRWRDKTLCVDLPMNATYLLERLSISPDELDAVIFTHNHDDHIGDLALLLQAAKKVTVICPKVVWKSILLKAAPLFDTTVDELKSHFDYRPIRYGIEHEIDYAGLRIRAFPSIHSVPCAIYHIYGQVDGTWKTYAHLSDILNLQRSRILLKQGYIDRERLETYQGFLLQPVDLKKIDVGTPEGLQEGSIHGFWKDFIEDRSQHIVLSHIRRSKLPHIATLTVGQTTLAGCAHDLASNDAGDERIDRYLNEYFADFGVEKEKLRQLADNPVQVIPPFTPFIKCGEIADCAYLVLGGMASVWTQQAAGWTQVAKINPGDLIGDMGVLRQMPRNATVRADTYLRVLRIPDGQFRDLATNTQCALQTLWRRRSIIQGSRLFDSEVALRLQHDIARQATDVSVKRGEPVPNDGALWLSCDPQAFTLLDGEPMVFGAREFISDRLNGTPIIAREDTEMLRLDHRHWSWLRDIPVFKQRLQSLAFAQAS